MKATFVLELDRNERDIVRCALDMYHRETENIQLKGEIKGEAAEKLIKKSLEITKTMLYQLDRM